MTINYFNLSLPIRYTLAAIAGSWWWFVDLLLQSSGVDSPVTEIFGEVIPFVLFGAPMALLVLLPAFEKESFQPLRVAALVVGASIIEELVIRLGMEADTGLGLIQILPVMAVGTMLLVVLASLLGSIRISQKTVAAAGMAGVMSALILDYLFNKAICGDDCPWWQDVYFTAPWVIWYILIVATLEYARDESRQE